MLWCNRRSWRWEGQCVWKLELNLYNYLTGVPPAITTKEGGDCFPVVVVVV